MKIETERLIIRPWNESDIECFLTLANDIGYNCFSTPGQFLTKTPEEAKIKIDERIKFYNKNKIGKFPLFRKDTLEFIGTCGLDHYQINGKEQIELGYRLLLKHWGNGYAKESAKAIVNHSFNQGFCEVIYAFALKQNQSSINVLQKLKFEYNGEMIACGGLNHSLYSMTKVNWAHVSESKTVDPQQAFVKHAVFLNLVKGKTTSQEQIKSHITYLRQLDKKGVLEICGPFTSCRGGLIILNVSDLVQATEIAANDPFVIEGVRTFEVRTWTLSCEANNHLGMG